MSKELDLQIRNLSSTWEYKERPAVIVEMASVISESHHTPDIGSYEVRGEKLYSPTHKRFVEDVTYGYKDKKLVSHLQSWANNNTEGLAIWISPPLGKDNPETKIALFDIWTGRSLKYVKFTFNQYDLSEKEILDYANFLYTYSVNPLDNVSVSEELRDKLIIAKDKESIRQIFQQIFPGFDDRQRYKNHVQSSARLYRESYNKPIQFEKGLKVSFGQHGLSCPTVGIASALTGEFKAGVRILKCNCHFCHAQVFAEIYAGKIHCPSCGKSASYHC